ncbi:hypothetical protein C4D60_Mb01t16070 [Musa balbisiana]|uniref:Uncharacterized protein n=1 Tax=Musa balbisiana TaxID=52838 RepID=A0A4S8JNY3_MUSBA|nr:hypothetical protein C4D60_Mb01t16070 [Musa balbisiana]
MTRRQRMWNDWMSSMGSLWLLMPDPQAALLLEEQSYMVAVKVKASPKGSFTPLRTLIDLVMVLDVS